MSDSVAFWRWGLPTALATILTTACAPDPPAAPGDLVTTFDTIGGVVHVTNTGTAPPARLDLVVSIGPKTFTQTESPDEFGWVSSVALAIRTVRRGGTALLMGICDGPTALSFDHYLTEFMSREVSLVTTFGFTRRDFLVGNALHAAGKLNLTALTGATVTLEQVPEALARIAEEGTDGKRLVVDVAIG